MTREEAIEKIKKVLPLSKTLEEAFYTLHPELCESEDERLRKLLVWQVHRNIEDETNDLKGSVYDGIKGHDPDLEESIEDWKKCLAYLEKQKEQKPAEWSDNDDQLIGFIFDLLNDLVWQKDWAMSKEECLERLKSLRPSWKPSEVCYGAKGDPDPAGEEQEEPEYSAF